MKIKRLLVIGLGSLLSLFALGLVALVLDPEADFSDLSDNSTSQASISEENAEPEPENLKNQQVSEAEDKAFDEFTTTIDVIGAQDPDFYIWYAGASLDFPKTDRLKITVTFEYQDLTADEQQLFRDTLTKGWSDLLKKHDPSATPSIRFVDVAGKELYP